MSDKTPDTELDPSGRNTLTDSVRVRFGPRVNQSVPLAWAEKMLTDLAKNRANVFRELLSAAALDGIEGPK